MHLPRPSRFLYSCVIQDLDSFHIDPVRLNVWRATVFLLCWHLSKLDILLVASAALSARHFIRTNWTEARIRL